MSGPDPPPPTRGNRVGADEVRTMFDRIAPIYDPMNTLMTVGLDARWRRAAVRAARLAPGAMALDVACGSGGLTRELARAAGPGGSVVGIDVSAGMLARARRRPPRAGGAPIRYLAADALALPFSDRSFDAVTVAFGLRNLADYGRALSEMARVTRPGGRVVVLEIATPAGGIGHAVAAIWFQRVVPLVGRAAGGGTAYRYLPDSVRAYPSPGQVAALMRAAGLDEVGWRQLTLGMVTLHVGRRAVGD